MSELKRIRLYKPEVTEQELIDAVTATHRAGVYTRGGQVSRFEESLSRTVGVEHAIATSNGTTALHLAVKGAGWREGEKVITSPMSFIATTNVLLQEKITPVFGPINRGLQLDLDACAALIENDPSIKGILLPLLYGHPADLPSTRTMKETFPNVAIIEDAAQALAPEDAGLGVGTAADIATYSFHENKVITTMGEGGAVVTNNPEFAEAMRRMREQGRINSPDWKEQVELGYNYRMTEAQAHTGVSQLARLESILAKRAVVAGWISDAISTEGFPLELPEAGPRSWFAYYAIANSADEGGRIVEALNEAGIDARVNPMPAIPTFNHVKNAKHEDYSGDVVELAEKIIMLPMHTQMEHEDVDRVVGALKKVFSAHSFPGRSNMIPSSEFYNAIAEQYGTIRAERSNYIERINRLTVDTIKSHASSISVMLDVGCGDGVRGKQIAKALGYELVSIDNSEEMVAVAMKQGIDAFVADISEGYHDRLPEKSFGVVTLLWNVLGHVGGEQQRLSTLLHIHNLLADDGLLVLDVNNLFNAEQYGKEAIERNRMRLHDSPDDTTVGDFVTQRQDWRGAQVSTVSHIFHSDEVISLLEEAGFHPTVRYIHYQTGDDAEEESGQIFITATKRLKRVS